MQCHDDGLLFHIRIIRNGYQRTSTSSTTHSSEVCKSLREIYKLSYLGVAHWAETDCGLSAGQHAVLDEGKGKGRCVCVCGQGRINSSTLPVSHHFYTICLVSLEVGLPNGDLHENFTINVDFDKEVSVEVWR